MKNNKNNKVIPIRNTTKSKNIEMIDKDDLAGSSLEMTTIANIEPDFFCPDSDVVIYDIEILKSDIDDTYMSLRLANLGDKDILGLYFKVTGYDIAGKKLGEQEYSLIDLKFKPGAVYETGGIKLFHEEIMKARIDITKIVDSEYSSREVKVGRLVPMPKLVKISDKLDNITIEILGLADDEKYFVDPITDGFIMCTCGHLRKKKCPLCGREDGLDNDMNEVYERIEGTITQIVGDVKEIKSLAVAYDTRNRLDRHLMTIATISGMDKVKEFGKKGLAKLDKRIKKLERREKIKQAMPKVLIIAAIIAILAVAGYFGYQHFMG